MADMTESTTGTAPHVVKGLHAVMCDVIAISKDRRNKEQGFSFRGVDDVVNAVGPSLRTHMVMMSPEVLDKERREYVTGRGTRMTESLVKMSFTFTSAVDGSKHRVGPVWGEAADAGDKSMSKAQSVAERVALLIALCIPTDQPDPDETVVDNYGPPLADREETDEMYEHIKVLPDSERRALKREFKKKFGLLSELKLSDVDPAWSFIVDWEMKLAKEAADNAVEDASGEEMAGGSE